MFIQFIVNAHNVRKTTKMVNFDHIFDVFSVQYNWIVLIYFSSCQTSPGTSLEYPHHILLEKIRATGMLLKIEHLCNFWASMSYLEPNYPLSVLHTCVRRCMTRLCRIHVNMSIQFIKTIWMLIMPKKINFEMTSKKILAKRLKFLKIHSAL